MAGVDYLHFDIHIFNYKYVKILIEIKTISFFFTEAVNLKKSVEKKH